MRCMTLAEQLKGRGAQIVFICREHPGHIMGVIEGRGYRVLRLPAGEAFTASQGDVAHAAWLGADWEQDAQETAAVLEDAEPTWLVIDHYAIDRRWEERLRSRVGRIMAIDDLADRPHDCDLLLDQNLYDDMEHRYDRLVPGGCLLLAGPRYALLRSEFADARRSLRERDGGVRRILVFFGGSDAGNETCKTLSAIAMLDRPEFAVDVIVGGANPHLQEVEALCRRIPNATCHVQVADMAQLMASADLAIGAGGTATWERCSLGLPAFVAALAANQYELAETGARHGLFFYLGQSAEVSKEEILNALKVFIASPQSLRSYSAASLATVDARGAQRVAGVMAPPRITLREARAADCDDVYRWRNAVDTRRFIFDSEPIPLEVHREWFARTLRNPDRVLLVGEIAGRPVGVLRYDISGAEALISVYLVPGGQGQGFGSQLIRCGSLWMREHHPEIKAVNAEIFPENGASLRAFEFAGYALHHMIYQEVL